MTKEEYHDMVTFIVKALRSLGVTDAVLTLDSNNYNKFLEYLADDSKYVDVVTVKVKEQSSFTPSLTMFGCKISVIEGELK